MTDPRVAAIHAQRKRLNEVVISLIVMGSGYFFVMIWVLSQFQLPQVAAGLVFLPLPIVGFIAMMLRHKSKTLVGDAAHAQVAATMESLDRLEEALADNEATKRRAADESDAESDR